MQLEDLLVHKNPSPDSLEDQLDVDSDALYGSGKVEGNKVNMDS